MSHSADSSRLVAQIDLSVDTHTALPTSEPIRRPSPNCITESVMRNRLLAMIVLVLAVPMTGAAQQGAPATSEPVPAPTPTTAPDAPQTPPSEPEREYSSYVVVKGGYFGSRGDFEGNSFSGNGAFEAAIGWGRTFGLELGSGYMETDAAGVKVKTVPVLHRSGSRFPSASWRRSARSEAALTGTRRRLEGHRRTAGPRAGTPASASIASRAISPRCPRPVHVLFEGLLGHRNLDWTATSCSPGLASGSRTPTGLTFLRRSAQGDR